AETIRDEDLALLVGQLLVERGIVGAEGVALPHHVRSHSRPDDRGAVALALADRVAAVGIEAVAERAGALVHEEAVLALPARAIGGVEGVDVEVAPERVER